MTKSYLSEGDSDVIESLQGRLVSLLHHVGDHLHVLEDRQPELNIRNEKSIDDVA